MAVRNAVIDAYRESAQKHRGCETFSDRLAMHSLKSLAVDVPEFMAVLEELGVFDDEKGETANPTGYVGS